MVSWARSIFVILVVLASAMLVYHQTPPSSQITTTLPYQPFGPGSHRTYWLHGATGATCCWNGTSTAPALTASDGDTISIVLQSDDTAPHNWYLDFNSDLAVDSNEIPTRSPDFTCASYCLNFTITLFLGQGNYTSGGQTHVGIPHGGIFTYRCQYHSFMHGDFNFNAGPVASFTHTPSTPLAHHPALFNGSTSWPTTGFTITDYRWDFGDINTTSSGSNPTITHSYATNSTFTVVLTVTDSDAQTAQYTASITVLSSFDYKITVSPANSTITAGESINPVVNLQLTIGPSQNVTLSSSISPKDSLVQQYLDVPSGYPPFNAVLHISTTVSNLCVPDPCLLSKTYTITIMAVSGTGVNQNTTFTIVLKPNNSQSYSYLPIIAAAAVAAVAVLALFMLYRRRKSKPGPLLLA